MAAPKGFKPPGGSRKGRPNKATAALKDMILRALDGVGGIAYLEQQARDNPGVFLSLVGKVLPLMVKADIKQDVTVKDDRSALAEAITTDLAAPDAHGGPPALHEQADTVH